MGNSLRCFHLVRKQKFVPIDDYKSSPIVVKFAPIAHPEVFGEDMVEGSARNEPTVIRDPSSLRGPISCLFLSACFRYIRCTVTSMMKIL
ncbi:hypothetical protein ANCCAN_28408 [Ancylostoma caninum]|uniref:Uncharacterized protein n=1 Tax=Ancylostoma caninum TaxID=29170 RepID=A0A368F6R0_ANCCA|nr:hypothetical protein ANCCAN_28408 [Ancylostoma caninum]